MATKPKIINAWRHYPLRIAGYLNILGCLVFTYAGIVGDGTTFAPAGLQDASKINWPIIWIGLYAAAIGFTLLTTPSNRKQIEQHLQKARKSTNITKYIKIGALKFAKIVVERPVESQAILALPIVIAYPLASMFAGGTWWDIAIGIFTLFSILFRILILEPMTRPYKNFGDFTKKELVQTKNPINFTFKYFQNYPLQMASILQILAQLSNVASGTLDDAPVTKSLAGFIIIVAMLIKMYCSKNQNLR